MKKIIIFYASYGGGHLSAAKSIKEHLEKNYNDVNVEMIDCMKYISNALEKITTGAYKEMAKKLPGLWGHIYMNSQKGPLGHISSRANKIMAIKLKNLILEKSPDFIISTHPFSSQMVSYLKRKGKINCKLATILTDFASHEQWLVGHEFTDLFFVSNDNMEKELIDFGVEKSKIYVTGIPMSERFFEKFDRVKVCSEFNLDPNKNVILFFGGGEFGLGKDRTTQIFRSLISNATNYQIVAIAGKNEKMKQEFERIVSQKKKEETIKVLPFTDKVPELMSISDLVITKPGGLTVSESLASHLPLIVINPIPGQEEENAEFLENAGCSIWLKKNDNVEKVLSSVLNDEAKLEELKSNSIKLSKQTSTQDICNIILSK